MVKSLQEAARLIKNADAIAIFAGAGMGVDSGLEQYWGEDGLWIRSILMNNKEINYYDLMKPAAFRQQIAPAINLVRGLFSAIPGCRFVFQFPTI
jgi:NAD-dependent SIR2 family protein deacetylase